MLSQKTKARIKRNKARRIQCRTKDGRDLYRLVRRAKQRTTAAAIKFLLDYALPKTRSNRELFFPVSSDETSTNPNNCLTCDHKQNPEDGHCYMFRDAPTEVCMQHTGRKGFGGTMGILRFL